MIRRCDDHDFETTWSIINDGAQAYRGIIPADRFTEPYMSREKLRHEIDEGVVFWGYTENGELVGVMGIQPVGDVTLIRHAYVRTGSQKRGIGAHLLTHLRELATGPILIGTWTDAVWAIRFYERHGFRLVGTEEKNRLLNRYWTVPSARLKPPLCWPMRNGGASTTRGRPSVARKSERDRKFLLTLTIHFWIFPSIGQLGVGCTDFCYHQ